jgi:hypothetical protein
MRLGTYFFEWPAPRTGFSDLRVKSDTPVAKNKVFLSLRDSSTAVMYGEIYSIGYITSLHNLFYYGVYDSLLLLLLHFPERQHEHQQ